HDVAAMDRSNRQILLHGFRIICGKCQLVEKEVIAYENRGIHRLGGHDCSLGNSMCKNPDKCYGRTDAFDPLPDAITHKHSVLMNASSDESSALVPRNLQPSSQLPYHRRRLRR